MNGFSRGRVAYRRRLIQLGLEALRAQAQLRFLLQLVALVFQLAQFIATDSDIKGLWRRVCVLCPLLTSQMACLNGVPNASAGIYYRRRF
jgi:hypothetical protein